MPASFLVPRVLAGHAAVMSSEARGHDLFIHNARFFERDDADCALALDGRFAFVGRASDANVPVGVPRFNAGGRLVLPGFVDAHAHLLNTGFAKRSIDLKDVASVEDALRRVAERAAVTPAGAWLRGAGWDQHRWPSGAFPTRQQLDAAAPKHPAILVHTSGHCVWVNSAALRAAGVTSATASPPGGAIDHGDDGEPTGILRDNAARLVEAIVPHPPPDERIAALRDAVAHAHALGVTGAHAMDVGRGEYQTLLALRDAGMLRFRVRPFMTATRLDEWFERALQTGDGDEMLRIGGVKFFADGALGSLTAWMEDPYEGSEDRGFPLQPVEVLERDVRRCLDHGLAPAVHAIGDRANHEVLDMFERLRDIAPQLSRRIEHAQALRLADIPRFAALAVTASMQPIHATQDWRKVDRYWGERGRHAYAFASLAATGASIAFGSDTPVETMDPLAGLRAAMTRQSASAEPDRGWYPDERLTFSQALAMYTRGPAAALGEGRSSGRIAEGYHADCVVLDGPLPSAINEWWEAAPRVAVTIVAGALVFQSAED